MQYNRLCIWTALSVALSVYPVSFASGQVTYTDVTNSAGVSYTQSVPIADVCTPPLNLDNFLDCSIRAMSGGLAVGDFDNDGLDDLYITTMGAQDILFRNNGGGTFSDATAGAGLGGVRNTNGALWCDVDNDGDLDLFISTIKEFRYYFFLNNGNGTFSEEGIARGLALSDGQQHAGTSIAAGDYDKDGFLDLIVGEWGNAVASNVHARLFRNRGVDAPGYFEDVTTVAGIDVNNGGPEAYIFAPAFVDLDQDGWVDLAIAADFGNSQLYWNDGDGTFTDEGGSANIGSDEYGMGSTFGDINHDGFLDWFVTSIYHPECYDETCAGPGEGEELRWFGIASGNRLYIYDSSRAFVDGTDAYGVRDGGWGWGASMFDHNNDTHLDIVMCNGVHLLYDPPTVFWSQDISRFFLNNGDGTTTESSAVVGIADTRQGRGLVTFDYGNDGDLDIMVANNADSPLLYRNDGGNTAGDWLRIKFKAAHRPFEGLNAKIRVQAIDGELVQIREMGVATHFLGQSERVAHFGLGAPSALPVHVVSVEWPLTGTVQTFNDVARNQVFVITAPAAEVVDVVHDADANGDFVISLVELLRVIQFFNCGEYSIDPLSADGWACGDGDRSGFTHTADFMNKNWRIDLGELLRIIQFFNSASLYRHFSGEDGYQPGPVP